VRRLAHENLIPALERFCVLLSRLRGLSRFQDSNATLGLSTQELDNILDTVNCVQLLAHHILICARSELRQFTAFSAWLRLEIELQSADASSTSANEATDKDFNIDHTSTLEYIQGAMMQSQLIGYFNMQSQGDQKQQRDLSAEGRSFFEVYKRELKDLSNHITPQKQIPGLEELISHLDTQCNLMFARIAETQRRNVRLGTPISLGADIPACMDLRMIIEVGEIFGMRV
jgi:anaphase-promoting complex subunit 4